MLTDAHSPQVDLSVRLLQVSKGGDDEIEANGVGGGGNVVGTTERAKMKNKAI